MTTAVDSHLDVVRVLLVTESLQIGGAEMRALHLAELLPRDRFQIELAVLGGARELAARVLELGVSVHTISRRGGLDPRAVTSVTTTLRDGGFHTVMGLLHYSSMVAGLSGNLAGTPVRIASNVGDRSVFTNDLAARKQRLVKAIAYRTCNRVFVNSRFMADADRVLHSHRHKLRVIHNGLRERSFSSPEPREATRRALGMAPEAPLLSVVGRLTPSKDIETFLGVVDRLRVDHPDVRGVVVGDGPHRSTLESAAARAGLDDSVVFTGTLPDPRPLLAASDVFVFTSLRESLPNVILEAMALGLPVVSARTAGVPELIDEGTTGALCEGSDVEGFTRAVDALLRDPTKRERWGEAGRLRAREHFHWDRQIDEFAALFTP